MNFQCTLRLLSELISYWTPECLQSCFMVRAFTGLWLSTLWSDPVPAKSSRNSWLTWGLKRKSFLLFAFPVHKHCYTLSQALDKIALSVGFHWKSILDQDSSYPVKLSGPVNTYILYSHNILALLFKMTFTVITGIIRKIFLECS